MLGDVLKANVPEQQQKELDQLISQVTPGKIIRPSLRDSFFKLFQSIPEEELRQTPTFKKG